MTSIIDTHIHSIFRSNDDFINLVNKGVKTAITVAFYPIVPLYTNTLIDLFNWIIQDEPRRTESTGISILPAVGIHPRSIPQDISKENLKKIRTKIVKAIEGKKIVALGEIGLESISSVEVDIFEFHLQIAKEYDIPVIIHTPRKNKRLVTEKIIKILSKNRIEKGVLDHINMEIINIGKKIDLNLGLTVQIGKLTPLNFYQIINEYEGEINRFVLNTDVGRDEANLYAAPEAVSMLEKKGINKNAIDLIAFQNAKKLFNL
ncbi:MAG: TatD family hydrolase [Candidatus Helarchaeota archaeon]